MWGGVAQFVLGNPILFYSTCDLHTLLASALCWSLAVLHFLGSLVVLQKASNYWSSRQEMTLQILTYNPLVSNSGFCAGEYVYWLCSNETTIRDYKKSFRLRLGSNNLILYHFKRCMIVGLDSSCFLQENIVALSTILPLSNVANYAFLKRRTLHCMQNSLRSNLSLHTFLNNHRLSNYMLFQIYFKVAFLSFMK